MRKSKQKTLIVLLATTFTLLCQGARADEHSTAASASSEHGDSAASAEHAAPAASHGAPTASHAAPAVSSAESAAVKLPPLGSFQVATTKTGKYFLEGIAIGGARAVTQAALTDIRRAAATREGYERIVFDLKSDSEAGLPYYQVQLVPKESRLVVSLWGNVSYAFDKAKIRKSFQKSESIQKLNVLPRVEDGLAIIEMGLKPVPAGRRIAVEVFQLAGRVIVDIKR